MDHELSGKIAELASRVNNLVVASTGDNCRILQQLEDQLTKYVLVAIRMDLDSEALSYKAALTQLNTSIAAIDSADDALSKIGDIITDIKNCVDLVDKALTIAASFL
jgi:hypothetical protein